METKKVWFITGASKGLGLTLVKQLLNSGYRVAATSRSLKDLTQAAEARSERFLPLSVDLRAEDSVGAAVQEVMRTFGRIDVVVNNAGYALTGGLEELSDEEARKNFDINVFGSLNVIRKVLPHMRSRQAGHIFNISSIGGFTGLFPGFGIYCATKFAVQGFTESLAEEVKEFGIHATIVSPGYFRTDFLTPESLNVPQNQIDAYKQVRASQEAHQTSINGNQQNDPEKGVSVLIQVAESNNPPLHLFLGEDAYGLANAKIDVVIRDMENWKHIATATGIDAVAK
jgi:NAD(P)-dependent dehydrogenase (short-subunit alcohol dehydrogenase family)